MKRLIVFLLILILFPFVSYAQIWEGDGGQGIDEGLGFGSGSGGGSIDWDEFTGDKCTITFQTYDGSSPAQSAVVPVGVPSSYVMQDIDEPTKAGYIFGGWSLLEDYPTPVEIPNNFIATTTYYAIFTKTRYTVYYNNPDNSQYTSQTYEYNEEIVEPTEPTYTNDYFWDWENLPDEMPAATFTVKAQVFPKTTIAYGLEVDLDAVSSATAYTYLYNAEGMNPIRVAADGTFNNFNDSATSWKSFIYQYVKPCMLKLDGTVDYYLDTEDQSLRADGVTASDISNASYEGNAMVEFRKLWSNAKRIRGTRKYRLLITPNEIPNITFAEAFKREDGTYVDNVYYSMFQASYNGTRATSLGIGDVDTTYSYLISNSRIRSQANGNGWDTTYEALTQHILKLLFMVGQTIEPYGALYNKNNIPVTTSTAPNCKQYGITNGCFFVKERSGAEALIKTLWICDLFGSRCYMQNGLVYYNGLIKAKYPPFPEYKSQEGYETIYDVSNDSAYLSNASALYYTRLSFVKGIAVESKFSTSSSSVTSSVFSGSITPCWFGIASTYRYNNKLMYSNRVPPYRLDRTTDNPTSVTYHHCGYNSENYFPNGSVWGYRLTYVAPSATSLSVPPLTLSRPKLLGTSNSDQEEIIDYATPTTDIGETR